MDRDCDYILKMFCFYICIVLADILLFLNFHSVYLSDESDWTVFKFVEHGENSEKQLDQRSKIKFKIMSLKVKGGIEYVPELVS